MYDGFIKVAAATPEIRVADTRFNAEAIIAMAGVAAERGAKLIVFPELCITGYTCGDLFLQPLLLRQAKQALVDIARRTAELDALIAVGLPFAWGGAVYNCAAMVSGGRILGLVPKKNIPNYGEFYEKRYFASGYGLKDWDTLCLDGEMQTVFGPDLLFPHTSVPDLVVGCEICEDLWVPEAPSVRLALNGATVIVNLSASDETVTKDEYRKDLVSVQSARLVCGYVYAGAGDGESTTDVVFTGSRLICENGAVLAKADDGSGLICTELDVERLAAERRRMGVFTADGSDFVVCPWGGAAEQTELTRHFSRAPFVPQDADNRAKRCQQVLQLQSLGLKRRVEHVNAKRLVVGVSGGLDSTLAMLVCAGTLDLLGRDRRDLLAVTMPCFGTTSRTRSNAELLAESLGAELRTVDISGSVTRHFEDIGHDPKALDVVFENAQARERTQVIMDIANGEGGLVVGTGDLSELALGWATYNGDHMSMYGVNGGVPKTLVRHLVRYYADTTDDTALRGVLMSILDTPVSPELLPAENGEISQKTEDLVGPYELHDFFLYYAVRWGYAPKKVYRLARYAFAGQYDKDTILKWLKTFYRRFFSQQFKRSCLPDGPKVGSLTLSPRGDWRMPSDASSAIWLAQLDEIGPED